MITRFIRRAAAYLIDSFLVRVLIRPEAFLAAWYGSLSKTGYSIAASFGLLLTTVYVVGCHKRWGCTIGKKILSLRVATADGISPPPFGPAFFRFAPLLVIGAISLTADYLSFLRMQLIDSGRWQLQLWQLLVLMWFVAEVIVALSTAGARSLHDLIASTVVVDAKENSFRSEVQRNGRADGGK
jgi:uncharacterized RDD family membrane protein YckC